MEKKPKPPTKAALHRKIKELEAQMSHSYHFAAATLDKAGPGAGSGSSLIVTLTWLGGREAIVPVAIRGGLSPDTIAALRRDIVRSYEEAVELKPKAS